MEIACLYIGMCLGAIIGIVLTAFIMRRSPCQCCGRDRQSYACQDCYKYAAEMVP